MEINRRSVLSVIARYFGLDNSDIDRRLELQKTIYLLQASGIDLGYGFKWYKLGPYSQELADDSYEVLTTRKKDYDETSAWKFDEETTEELDKFKKIWQEIRAKEGQLELVSSLDFMKEVWGENIDKEKSAYDKLKEKKTTLHDDVNYTLEDVGDALKFREQIRSS